MICCWLINMGPNKRKSTIFTFYMYVYKNMIQQISKIILRINIFFFENDESMF